MADTLFRKHEENWKQFIRWEIRKKTSRHPQKALQMIGEWVDFFRLRHPKQSGPSEVLGVRKMQRSLSHLSRAE